MSTDVIDSRTATREQASRPDATVADPTLAAGDEPTGPGRGCGGVRRGRADRHGLRPSRAVDRPGRADLLGAREEPRIGRAAGRPGRGDVGLRDPLSAPHLPRVGRVRRSVARVRRREGRQLRAPQRHGVPGVLPGAQVRRGACGGRGGRLLRLRSFDALQRNAPHRGGAVPRVRARAPGHRVGDPPADAEEPASRGRGGSARV